MLKWRYPILNDSDFEFEDGNREKMLSKLAKKLDKSLSELKAVIAELQLY